VRYIVSYSGGKDSTALLLWAIAKYGKQNIIVVAADTGAEFPETFNYFEYIKRKLGVKVHIAKSDKWDFFSYCRYRQMFPSSGIRFCTSRLKTEPIAKWITANCNRKEDIMLTGERREESNKRAGYEPDYYNKVSRIQGHRPILNLSTNEVFTAIRQAGLEPHPVYQHWTRLGCYCCVFNTNDEWVTLHRYWPELFGRVADLEAEIGYTVRQGITLRELIRKHDQPRLAL